MWWLGWWPYAATSPSLLGLAPRTKKPAQEARLQQQTSSRGPLAASFRCPAPPDQWLNSVANSGHIQQFPMITLLTSLCFWIQLRKMHCSHSSSASLNHSNAFLWSGFSQIELLYAKRSYLGVKLRSTFHKFTLLLVSGSGHTISFDTHNVTKNDWIKMMTFCVACSANYADVLYG